MSNIEGVQLQRQTEAQVKDFFDLIDQSYDEDDSYLDDHSLLNIQRNATIANKALQAVWVARLISVIAIVYIVLSLGNPWFNVSFTTNSGEIIEAEPHK